MNKNYYFGMSFVDQEPDNLMYSTLKINFIVRKSQWDFKNTILLIFLW